MLKIKIHSHVSARTISFSYHEIPPWTVVPSHTEFPSITIIKVNIGKIIGPILDGPILLTRSNERMWCGRSEVRKGDDSPTQNSLERQHNSGDIRECLAEAVDGAAVLAYKTFSGGRYLIYICLRSLWDALSSKRVLLTFTIFTLYRPWLSSTQRQNASASPLRDPRVHTDQHTLGIRKKLLGVSSLYATLESSWLLYRAFTRKAAG